MKATYFIVTTTDQGMGGWKIVAGPFDSRKEAESDACFTTCESTDVYAQTEFRNSRVCSYSALKQLTTGIPRRRLGEAGRDQLIEAYRWRAPEFEGE